MWIHSARWVALALAMGIAPVVADQPVVELTGPEKGFRITNEYDRSDFGVALEVTYRRPGTVLDTVGINAAPVGSFTLAINSEGRVSVALYDPHRPSPQRLANGWHQWVHPRRIGADEAHSIMVQLDRRHLRLIVDRQPLEVDCETTLSGEPFYVGDFKGDETWGDGYSIHNGLTGTVKLLYYGTAAESAPAEPANASAADQLLVDQTGRLTDPDRRSILGALANLSQSRGYALAILVVENANIPDDLPKVHRNELIAAGVLPHKSAVFVTGGNRFWWQRDNRVNEVVTFEQVKELWFANNDGPLGENLLALVRGLSGGAVATPPTQPTQPAPPVAAAALLSDPMTQLTAAERQTALALLPRVAAKRGFALAVLLATDDLPDGLPKQHRDELLAAGALPPVSAVLVLSPGRMWWQRDNRVNEMVGFEEIKELWLGLKGRGIGPRLIGCLQGLAREAVTPVPVSPAPTPAPPTQPTQPAPPTQPAQPTPPPTTPSVPGPGAIETVAGGLEAALRRGDLETAGRHLSPDVREPLLNLFRQHPEQAARAAELLASRRFVAATAAGIAEYQVTDGGRTWSLQFHLLEEGWVLSSF